MSRFEFRAHDVSHGKQCRIELERDDGNDNIPIGDDPDRHTAPVHALHDQQISHMVHAHELSSFVNGGLPCCGYYVTDTNVSDKHGGYPFEIRDTSAIDKPQK